MWRSLCSIVMAWCAVIYLLPKGIADEPPLATNLDETFQFGETNFTVINDIELFPDGRIAYGGAGQLETIGQAERNGAVVNSDSAGWFATNVARLTVDVDDRVIYSVGLPGGAVQRSTTWDDINWSSQSAVRGTPSQISLSSDRRLLVAGDLIITGDTNRYGLVRLTPAGKVDGSFAYTNFLGLDIKSAVVLTDGNVIATYLRTNGNLIWSEVGKWSRDGVRDMFYNGMWAESFGTNSQVTVMAKAPGTNGFAAAVRTEPVSGGGSFFSRIMTFDEAGNWGTNIAPTEGAYIEGTVNAIGFEVINAGSATNRAYDRVIVAGEFVRIGTNDCNNLASFNMDGSVAWCFPTNAGPSGPIHDVTVQPDGKVLIAGAFTNVNGIEAKGLARIYGSSARDAVTYLYWADTEFRGFEGGSASHDPRITMRRSGNLSEPLTVFLLSEHPKIGELVNIPAKIEFAVDAVEASADIGILNNALRGARERFEISANVTNASVLLTRAKTDFVVLDDETPGTLDPSYDIPYQIGRNAFGIQPDGKIIFGGYGLTLERYNPDGTFDGTFATNSLTGVGAGTFGISEIFPQPDGSVYVAGLFNTTNTWGINGVARLNADGTLDRRFNPGLRNLATRNQVKMLPLKNGDVLIWVVSGAQPQMYLEGIFRLDDRGNVIRAYPGTRPWLNEPIWTVTNAEELFTISGVSTVTKYTATAAVATNFPTTDIKTVSTMHAMGGWLLVGGNFTNIASVLVTNIARLDVQTGAVDTNFPTIVNGTVYLIREQEGKLYISGDFTEVNGRPRNRLARLNLDGSLDESFDPGLGPNRAAQQLEVQIEGSIMIGTAFDRVDGVNTEPIVRLHGDKNPGAIRFVSRRIEVSETNGFVTVEVERIGGSQGLLSATLWTIEGSALADQQFGSTNVIFTFLDGEFGRKSVRIPIYGSNELTGSRTFSVVVSGVSGEEEATVVLRDTNSPLLASAVVGSTTNAVRDMAVDPENGWVYLVGGFTNANDIAVTNVVRMNWDLAVDESFRLADFPALAVGGSTNRAAISTVSIQDGIALGGHFNLVGTNQWANVIRVRADGSFDADFNTAARTAIPGINGVLHLLHEPDGQLVASIPSTVIGSVRLNVDGTRDSTLNTGGPGAGSELWLDAPGRFYDLANAAPFAVRRFDSRGMSDGFRIPVSYNFGGGAPTPILNAIALQPDGKVLVGGAFSHAVTTSVSSASAPRFVRVLTNGVRDTNFVAVVGTNTNLSIKNRVSAIQPLADGSILIGGRFEVVNGERRTMLALVDTNGNLRSDFNVEVVGESIDQFAHLHDNTVVVRGNVSSVDGVEVGNLFKLALPRIEAPVAKFLWPTNGAEVRVTDGPNEVRMHVFDPDGYIERVVLELDGQAIATNSSGNVPFAVFLPPSGEHQLRVTATDASGLTTTETVRFETW